MSISFSAILNILLMVFFFGFCVFIHEFGHLLAGLWRRLHVERFSIGFGHAMWKKVIKGVEYRISWIPFGGYVALPQLEPSDKPVTSDGQELPEARPIDRIITAFAGPLFNILFALLLALLVWPFEVQKPKDVGSVRIQRVPETYTDVDGKKHAVPEYEAGLRAGDEIVAVNGVKLKEGFIQARDLIIMDEDGVVEVEYLRNKEQKVAKYKIKSHPNPQFRGAAYPFFEPYFPTYVNGLGTKENPSPAEKSGLQVGDLLVKINGKDVEGADWVFMTLQELNKDVTDPTKLKPADFVVRRGEGQDAQLIEIKGVMPVKRTQVVKRRFLNIIEIKGDTWIYGIQPGYKTEPVKISPYAHFHRVFSMMAKTVRVISGNNPIGVSALSGPVGIAKVMNRGFSVSFLVGLHLVILISISLAVFNLLPLPILDGGHITIAVLEMISRRKVPAKIMQPIFYLFFAIFITFAVFVTYHDIRQELVKPPEEKTEKTTEDTGTDSGKAAPTGTGDSAKEETNGKKSDSNTTINNK